MVTTTYDAASDANLSREIAKIMNRHDRDCSIDNERSGRTKSQRGITFIFIGVTSISDALSAEFAAFRLPITWRVTTASAGVFELHVLVETKNPPGRCKRFIWNRRYTIFAIVACVLVALYANQLFQRRVYAVCWTEKTNCGRAVAETLGDGYPWTVFVRGVGRMIYGEDTGVEGSSLGSRLADGLRMGLRTDPTESLKDGLGNSESDVTLHKLAKEGLKITEALRKGRRPSVDDLIKLAGVPAELEQAADRIDDETEAYLTRDEPADTKHRHTHQHTRPPPARNPPPTKGRP